MVVSFILILLFVFTMLVKSLYLPEVIPQEKNGTAEEVQHAICKITSKDLEATANATIFRELKGVCTSVELQTDLKRLESKILQEIDGIKNILKENGFRVAIRPVTRPSEQFQLEIGPIPEKPTLKNLPNQSKISNELHSGKFFNEPTVERSVEPVDSLENLVPKYLKDVTLTRNKEIAQYNDTVINSNLGNIYFFYWKIENIKDLLLKREMYISSPKFSVLGHGLHLQFYPNYIEDKSFALHLGASTKGFIKKHKIYILNQLDKNADIDSDLMFGFKGEESMFRVSEDITRESGYVSNNCMIVKLEILLNS